MSLLIHTKCMSKNSNNQRARFGNYIAYGIYRVLESLLRLLPMEIVCVIGAGLGQLGYWLMRKRRRIVIRNLRIINGDQMNHEDIRSLAQKTFRTSGLNFIASVRASTLSNDELIERVEVKGIDNLLKAYEDGHGCILILAHMGNWELLTQLSVLAPEIKSLASIYRPLDNPLLDNLVKRRRQRSGTQLFSRRDSFAKPISLLKSGGTLGAIADQHAGVHGLAVPLFGKITSMTSLPALLHRKTKAPIVPISMSTVGLGKWKVIFHPLIEIAEDEKKNTHLLTARCAHAYERIMRESPADVLWMHGYWKVGRQFPLRMDGTQKKNALNDRVLDTEKKSLKPFRILVYLGDSVATSPEVSDQLHYLKNFRSDAHLTVIGLNPEHLQADHVIASSVDDSPHLLSNSIAKLDLSQPTPFDCAIDFTDNSSGSSILSGAGLAPIFALHGKFQNRNTRKAREQRGDLSLSQFIETLRSPHKEP